MKISYMIGFLAIFLSQSVLVACHKTHDDVQITHLKIPSHVLEGKDVELQCDYESPVKMYSIKWYRNDTEFFYYIPSLKPSKRILTMPGISVDVDGSSGKRMILQAVNLDSEGRFKCEVSTEWPHYYTADKSEYMSVVVLPESKPKIIGANDQYRLGETIQLTCTSAPSRPKSELTWYINDREAPLEMIDLSDVPETPNDDRRLQKSCLTLTFVMTQHQFIHGRLTIRCSSVISSVLYHETRDHAVFEEVAFNVPVLDLKEKAAFSGRTSGGDTPRDSEVARVLLLSSLLLWQNLRIT